MPPEKKLAPVSQSGDAESWLHAQALVNALPRIPPVFSLAVRALMSDEYRGSQSLSPASLFMVNRLLRSPTMKAILYYSALTFHSDFIDNCPHLSSTDLARLYKPGDLAAMVGSACLYKTLSKLANPKHSSEILASLAKRLHENLNIAGYVGYAVPTIGAGRAVLAAAALPLAHIHFCHLNHQRGEGYAKSIYEENEPVDIAFENKIWGCSSYALASCLLQKMGFGIQWMNGLMAALTAPNLAASSHDDSTHFAFALYWIELLRTTGQGPTEKIPAVYYPAQKEFYQLLFRTTQVREIGVKHTWADKGKDDISPSLTPQLYQEYLAEAADPEEVKEFCNKNISSDLLEGISEQDYEQLTSKNSDPVDI